MNVVKADHWPTSGRPAAWRLLLNALDPAAKERWYQMRSEGTVELCPFGENTSICATSPGGSRAVLLGTSSHFEGAFGAWLVAREIVDLRSDSAIRIKLAVDVLPSWSNAETKLAYMRATEGLLTPRSESVLTIWDVVANRVQEIRIESVRYIGWRPDDSGLVAVVATGEELMLVSFDAGDLKEMSRTVLPMERSDQGISISPDFEFISYCGFRDDGESPARGGQAAFICRLSDQRVATIGSVCTDTQPAWSPSGRKLALLTERGGGRGRMVTVIDPRNEETSEVMAVDGDDLSGEITGITPAWSPDSELLAFGSYEADGQAIYIFDLQTGAIARVLQVGDGVSSLEFVRAKG